MEKSESKKNSKLTLLAASVAGLLAVTGAVLPQMAQAAEGDKAHCYGVNKCKGTGECGGKGHACAGQNACKGQGWVAKTETECLAAEGGRLTEEVEAKAAY